MGWLFESCWMNSQDPGLSKKSYGLPCEQVAECESVLVPSTFIIVENNVKRTFPYKVPLVPSQYEKCLRLSFPFPDLSTFSLTRPPSFPCSPQQWPLQSYPAWCYRSSHTLWPLVSGSLCSVACFLATAKHHVLSFASSFSNLGSKFSKKWTRAFSDF